MTKDPTAIGALQTRVDHLSSLIRTQRVERDRYQGWADVRQEAIAKAVAELASIQAAIELLEAAATYQP